MYGGSEFTIDTLTPGPVVITRVSGADFQSDLKGLPLQLNTQDFTGFGQISITEFVDADTLNGNLQFAQNLVDFTYQMNNTAFLNLPMGINQQNQLQLFGGQIGQQNFNYDYPYYVSLFPPTNTTYTEIDFEAISGVRYAALESFQNGTKFLAITLSDGPFSGSNEIAFISTDQGVRQITRINNGVFQTNNAAIYGDEDWVDIPSGAFGIFGGGFGLTVSYAVHIQPTNRATLPM